MRDKDDATRKILQMTVDGMRNRGRPKAEMARPGERGYGQKPDDNRDGRRHWHVMIRAGTLRTVEADS